MKKKDFTNRYFDQFPELETERLRLIEIKPQHAKDILRHFSEEAVTQYLDVARMQALEEAERLIDFLATRLKQERGIRWGITQQGEDQVIGSCGYNTWIKRKFQAELGYDLSKAYWRQGIATEAVKKVLQFGFTKMELQKIEALILPENIASEQFIKSLGFRWEGTVREFQISTGQYATMKVFSLKKHEWLSLASATHYYNDPLP